MLQAVAVLERLTADSGDRVGDDYACQAATVSERPAADSGDGVGDINVCQPTAIRVSVTYCISINLD